MDYKTSSEYLKYQSQIKHKQWNKPYTFEDNTIKEKSDFNKIQDMIGDAEKYNNLEETKFSNLLLEVAILKIQKLIESNRSQMEPLETLTE